MGASCFKWWNYVQLSRTDFNAVTCLAETCHSCLRRLIGNRFFCEGGCPARQSRPHARLRRDAATHHRRVNSKEFGDCACSRPHAPWQIQEGFTHMGVDGGVPCRSGRPQNAWAASSRRHKRPQRPVWLRGASTPLATKGSQQSESVSSALAVFHEGSPLQRKHQPLHEVVACRCVHETASKSPHRTSMSGAMSLSLTAARRHDSKQRPAIHSTGNPGAGRPAKARRLRVGGVTEQMQAPQRRRLWLQM